MIRGQSEDNPTIIRAWNRHPAPAASTTLLVPSWRRFCIEKYNISRSGYLPKCHEVLRAVTKSHPPTSTNTAPATQNQCHQWSCVTYETSFTMRGTSKVTLQTHQVLRLPHNMNYELWLYWIATVLNCDFTELLLYLTVTLLNCAFTELWLYWTVTLLICYFTELWLYWTVTLPNCYCT